VFGFVKKRRRKRIASRPFPSEWFDILAKNVPLYARLPTHDQEELQRHIQVFLAEKQFEGCGDQQITEEIRVTIAAQACVLLLHRETDYYPRVSSILVYPTTYVAPVVDYSSPWIVTEGKEERAGEAWLHGAVVLSWEDVLFGAADIGDGTNLTLHEFAHQLDMEDNVADGAPVLSRRSMYVAWARTLGAEYEQLQSDTDHDAVTVMDKYGATNPAEFFAVATECFFERPERLHESHPELYRQLKEFYQQDPIQFLTDRQSRSQGSS